MTISVKVAKENNSGSMFKLPGRRYAEGEKPSIGLRKNSGVNILFGNVASVDSDRMTMKVSLKGDRTGDILDEVLITQPYAGNSSYIAMVPEVGTSLILVETDTVVYPIGYVPNYNLGLRYEHIAVWDTNKVKTSDKNDLFYKFRKINEGELCFSSSEGGEIFLNENVTISTSRGSHVIIRPEDNVIVNSSSNNYVFASGVWSNSGIVQRNSIDVIKRDEGSFAYEERLKDGSINYNIMPGEFKNSADYFTEYRIEVEDIAKNDLPENDVNRFGGDTRRNPIAILSMGNFIGNNSRYEDTYGFILKPTLFKDYNDDQGEFYFDVLTGSEPDTMGMAFTLFSPNRRNAEMGAIFGADKEGHFYHYLPSGTGGGICPGRSMSILALGSKKEIWGSDSRYGNAWDLVLNGGMHWKIGNHGESTDNPHNNLSMDISTSKCAYLKYGNDKDLTAIVDFADDKKPLGNISKYKKIEVVSGCERKQVEMTRETVIEGNDLKSISGKEEVAIAGASNMSVGESFNLSVGNIYNEKVTKEKQEGYGSLKTTITEGKSILKMMPTKPTTVGNIEESILGKGDRSVVVTKGDITERIVTKGNRSFYTTAGNFEVTSIKGDLTLKTVAGKVVLKTVAGKLEMSSTIGTLIKTQGIFDQKASLINLKTKGAATGVITIGSHKDYITGAPLKGSLTVKACK